MSERELLSENERPLALEAVQREEQRAAELTERVESLRAREHHLSAFLAAAHAEGAETATLTAERRAVRDELEDLNAALPLLHERINKNRELACIEAARRRMLGIIRGAGSLREQITKSDARVNEAAEAMVEALADARERRARLVSLNVEAQCLAARWPELKQPAQLKASPADGTAFGKVMTAFNQQPAEAPRFAVGHRESADAAERRRNVLLGLREFARRHLDPDTEAARILAAAGPSREEAEADAEAERRKLERQRRDSDAMVSIAGEIARLDAMPPNVPSIGRM